MFSAALGSLSWPLHLLLHKQKTLERSAQHCVEDTVVISWEEGAAELMSLPAVGTQTWLVTRGLQPLSHCQWACAWCRQVAKCEKVLLSTNGHIKQWCYCSIPDTGMSGVLVPFTFDLCFWVNSVKHSGSDLWSNGSICCQASQLSLSMVPPL